MKALVRWFAENDVAANLLMVLILAGGILSILFQAKMEVFPEVSLDRITVSVIYPGAAPAEVEESIVVKIEEEVQGLEGIKRVTSTSSENSGTVVIELLEGADAQQALDDVKSRVDTIDTFPEEAEEPVIEEVTITKQVLNIAVSGDVGERTLKKAGEQVRDELLATPGITQVSLKNARPYEISVEISEDDLRQHGLTFDFVANAIRASSLDLPGGSVKTDGGEILLRSVGQRYTGAEFRDIPLLTNPDGSRVLLGDIATVIDGFEEVDQFSFFDGKPAVLVQVFRVGDQSALEISELCNEYIRQAENRFPEAIDFTIWNDESLVLRDRLELLIRNGASGLTLVFISLALFLQFKLAIWVSMGIPISFLGTFFLMPTLDVSINLISLFAFIVVLGIVVDDAIVVGENIFTKREAGMDGLEASKEGVEEVAVPVTFAILTTIVAFTPLMTIPGANGKIWRIIPIIVILTLIFSLIESKLILPAHLAHTNIAGPKRTRRGFVYFWQKFQGLFTGALDFVINKIYDPTLEFGLRWRYLTLSVAFSTMFLCGGLVGGGYVKFVFFPPVEADYVAAILTMPQGTPVEVTAKAVRRIEDAARQMADETRQKTGDDGLIRHMMTSVGEQPFKTSQEQNGSTNFNLYQASHLGEVTIELASAEERDVSSEELANRWREIVGVIPDAVELSFTSSLFSVGDPINIQLASSNLDHLHEAADRLKVKLREYPGVFDVADSFRAGKDEIELSLKPNAENYGVTMLDLARQIRQGFYGEEAQRIQRGRDEVKVMVRYPKDERTSIGDLEDLRIRSAGGVEVPFDEIAVADFGQGFSSIQRTDQKRSINVTADVDTDKITPNEIIADLMENFMVGLTADYPGMVYSLEGEQKEQADTLNALMRGFILAMIGIYALLAIPFGSYFQPFIVMSAIPFGIVGAVFGHLIMGMELSVLSLCGIVALAGVVVNDSLVLVDFVNRRRAAGIGLHDAVHSAGVMRFRPIMLTSITTFVGLAPMLFEKSMQAKFLIPMAVSLGYGVLFSTFITLGLVPVMYLILEDIGRFLSRGWRFLAWVYGPDEAPRPQ